MASSSAWTATSRAAAVAARRRSTSAPPPPPGRCRGPQRQHQRAAVVQVRELVDARWTHERLHADDATRCELAQALRIAVHETAPDREIDDRAPRGRVVLLIERVA